MYNSACSSEIAETVGKQQYLHGIFIIVGQFLNKIFSII